MGFAMLPPRYNSPFRTSVIVRSMIGILAAGECDYASVEKFHNDFLFRLVAGGNVPSQETLRQRLGLLAKRDWQDVVDSCVAWQLSRTNLTRVGHDGLLLIPLDIDVSVLEDTASRKEGISRTYHNVDGHAPIFCHKETSPPEHGTVKASSRA